MKQGIGEKKHALGACDVITDLWQGDSGRSNCSILPRGLGALLLQSKSVWDAERLFICLEPFIPWVKLGIGKQEFVCLCVQHVQIEMQACAYGPVEKDWEQNLCVYSRMIPEPKFNSVESPKELLPASWMLGNQRLRFMFLKLETKFPVQIFHNRLKYLYHEW